MEQLLQKLNQSIRDYQEMQEKQIQAFETEVMPDIENFNFERASVFADLKNHLDDFLNILHDEDQVRSGLFYQNKIKTILETEGILRDKIHQHKNLLQQHMGDTRNSRTAIKGYAGSLKTEKVKTLSSKG